MQGSSGRSVVSVVRELWSPTRGHCCAGRLISANPLLRRSMSPSLYGKPPPATTTTTSFLCISVSHCECVSVCDCENDGERERQGLCVCVFVSASLRPCVCVCKCTQVVISLCCHYSGCVLRICSVKQSPVSGEANCRMWKWSLCRTGHGSGMRNVFCTIYMWHPGSKVSQYSPI